MSSSRFSDLSPELLCLILQEISSTRDFYSLIRASSQAYSAFLPLREPILSNLLKRALSAEVLHHDARVALRSSQFPFPQNPNTLEHVEVSEAFLQSITNDEDIDLTDQTIPLDLSIPLCRFQSSMEYLIEDFCTLTFSSWNELRCPQRACTSSTGSKSSNSLLSFITD